MIEYKENISSDYQTITTTAFFMIMTSHSYNKFVFKINNIKWYVSDNIQLSFINEFKKELLWEKLKA